MAKRTNLEAVYPLTSMQEGLLFHTLYAGGSGVYVEQLSCPITSALDCQAFRSSWEQLLARHAVLRTSFLWERRERPLQVVARQVELPLEEHDWRGLSEGEQQRRLAEWLARDRAAGFELTRAPLLRLALFRLGEQAYHFVWSYHHVLLDGWSTNLVLRELFALYEAVQQGKPAILTQARPFGEYVGWLQRQDLSEAERFWRRSLAGLGGPTVSGVVQTRNPDTLGGTAEQVLRLGAESTAALERLARGNNLTLSTLLQGGWALLLARYSGETDVLFGVTVSGRSAPLAGIEAMVGLFVNTLPLRAQVEPQAELLPWLQALQAHHVEARSYEHTPLVQIQGWSDIPRGQALFESILAIENYPVDAAIGTYRAALGISEVHLTEQSNYPLMLMAIPGERLALRLIYDPARVTAQAAAQLLRHYEQLLTAMVADPNVCLRQLSLLSPQEQAQLRALGSGASLPYPHSTIPALFFAQAARTPLAPALLYGEVRLNYASLAEQAARLAHLLRARGVGPEVRVGVCLERSPLLVVALLGLLAAGGAYVPLDPHYPPARRHLILADAGIALVLTETALLERLAPVGGVALLALDTSEVREASAAAPTTPPQVPLDPDNLAYVIYTSGSTGTPKGVLGLHRGALNRFEWMWTTYPFGPDELLCQKTALGFLDSLWEIFGPLLRGQRLLLVPEATLADPTALVELLAEQSVTRLVLVPSLLQAILESQADLARRLPRLWLWVSSGEALPAALTQRFQEALPGRTLLNLYGASELSADATVQELGQRQLQGAGAPIGQPLANLQVYVLDEQLALVPVGVEGELYVGGVGLARGYHGRPDLTAERFIPTPFATTEDRRPTTDDETNGGGGRWSVVGGRLYRTGDRVRWSAEGVLEYVGRRDGQVQVRGFRVEVTEVEAALAGHEAVEVAVVVAQGSGAERRLVAYIVEGSEVRGQGSAEQALDTLLPDLRSLIPELRAYLAERLPGYMVPSLFVRLAAMPLTPSGKIDRRALPTPQYNRVATAAESVLSRTPIEEVLTNLWAQLLGVSRVEVADNFFDLGGHSLLATQLVARLRDVFGITVSVRTIFDAPTPRTLAQVVEQALRNGQDDALPPLRPAPRKTQLPLSFAQRRLWFFERFAPSSTAYNVFAGIRLYGNLDITALEQSFATVVERHETLRTTFADVDGEPHQIVHPNSTSQIHLIDMTHVSADHREAQALLLATEAVHQPFDLARGPLVRAIILRLAPQDHLFLLTTHHIVSDHWSMNLFFGELTELYNAHTLERPPVLPDLPIQYADYAHWQLSSLHGNILEKQLAYWVRQLAGAPHILELPVDYPRQTVQRFHGSRHYFTLPRDLTAGLRALSRREGVTLFMTLLGAFQTLLMRYTGQNDIVVSTGIGNRSHEAIEPLIGCFINILLLRCDLSDNPRFSQLLRRVREVCLNAYVNQAVPFERLVEELQPVRDPSHTPLTQVMLVLRNVPRQVYALANLSVEPVVLTSATSQFDLLFHVLEEEEELFLEVSYNTDLFKPATIARLATHFTTLLAGAIADPEQAITDLPLLSADERSQILNDWNATRVDFSCERTIPALFAQYVARAPAAVAIICGETQITYGELDARANKLAHHLQQLGVGPDVCVGILMNRSIELVVGLLGILKAGGAYVPLDSAYPSERLAFMLADACVPVLLTLAHLAGTLPGHSAHVLLLDRDWPAIDLHPATSPPSRISPLNLAYVIYTSGSTGLPKGVQVTSGGIVNNLVDLNTRFSVGPGDRTLALSSVSFDMCVYEVLGILVAGGAVIIPTAEAIRDPMRWAELLLRHAVTIWNSAPPLLKLLVEAIEERDEWHPRRLRLALLGGDWVPVTLPDRLRAMVPGIQVISLGGATEASIHSIIYPIADVDPAWKSIPYGVPMANQRAYILDRRLNPVPIGIAGELFLGGIGLARGYFARSDLTAERFVPNPFIENKEQRTKNKELRGRGGEGEATQSPISNPQSPISNRLYKTGDLARYHPDGTIELLGRIDYQVKVHGNRIELGEIEAALRQHPAVQEAVVTVQVRSGGSGEQVLAAYLVVREHETIASAELRPWLATMLPEYMIPSAFVVLDTLPLTPNGKVDRRTLPRPQLEQPVMKDSSIAPRNEIEERLAAAWSEILGISEVGIDDNFFDLGGTSFAAIKLVTRLDMKLSLVDLFQHPTVRELAQQVARQHTDHNRLLHRLDSSPDTGDVIASLVCFPYGGGSAVVYHPLAQALPENYALYAVELPGHDLNRLDQAPEPFEQIARRCADEILRSIAGPLVLYGHCAGTALALAVARLIEETDRELVAVFLGGALPWYHLADEAEMLAEFQSLAGLEGIDDQKTRDIIVRNMRHDVVGSTRYFQSVRRSAQAQRLKTPIYCVVGTRDPYTRNYAMRYAGWEVFGETVKLISLADAEHYFIKHQSSELAQVLVQTIAPIFAD